MCARLTMHLGLMGRILYWTGVGRWKWGTRNFFLRFPKSSEQLNPSGNTAANTQLFIEVLDDVKTRDTTLIKSYLCGGAGILAFRKLVTECLRDRRIASVIWADSPSRVINLGPKDGMATTKMCHLVRDQMLKMLSVGAIEWTGFIPPSPPQHTTDSVSDHLWLLRSAQSRQCS